MPIQRPVWGMSLGRTRAGATGGAAAGGAALAWGGTVTRFTFRCLWRSGLVWWRAGVLNSLGRFAAAGGTPILLNLCLIGAILGLARVAETPSRALAWGVAAAGVLQFIWLFMAWLGMSAVKLSLPRSVITSSMKSPPFTR